MVKQGDPKLKMVIDDMDINFDLKSNMNKHHIDKLAELGCHDPVQRLKHSVH